MGEFVKLELSPDTRVATILLERPPMNAISAEVCAELADAASQLSDNYDIGAVVIWGGSKIFAAGADIKEFPAEGDAGAEASGGSGSQQGAGGSGKSGGKSNPGGSGKSGKSGSLSAPPSSISQAFTAIAEIPQVTIAAVNGYALGGGCELAICTDFRVAGDDAVFGQPEVLLGIIPGAGATKRLPRLVGISKAKELMYTGRRVKADEALQIGLADEVCPAEQAFERALELAAKYAQGPAALRSIKKAVDEGYDLPMDEALQLETREFQASFKTEDAGIGVASFLEKGPGKAKFIGR